MISAFPIAIVCIVRQKQAKGVTENANPINALDSFEFPTIEELPLRLLDKQQNKSTSLVSNVDPEKYLNSRNQKFRLEFLRPLFVSHVEIDVEDFGKYSKMEFTWRSSTGERKKKDQSKIQSNKFVVTIGDLISEFSFKPPKQYLTTPKIKSIRIHGLEFEAFRDGCEQLSKLRELRAEVERESNRHREFVQSSKEEVSALDKKKSILMAEIDSLNSAKIESQNAAQSAEKELETAKKNVESTKAAIAELKTREGQLSDSIDQKEKRTDALNSQVEESQEELRQLKADINLFPTEISGFVSQGGKNIARYTILAFIPLGLLILYSYALFSNAADLTTVYTTESRVDLWTMFLSRIPFALISIFLIHAAYKLAKLFVSEVIKINQQRLNLSKVAIVAKDVSDSASFGAEFSEDEQYELRTKLKMDLLKSHLKGYVADDYEYDIDIGLWNRFLAWRKTRESSEDAG